MFQGTTGVPKGVMLTHGNVIADVTTMDYFKNINLTHEAHLSFSPFFFIFFYLRSKNIYFYFYYYFFNFIFSGHNVQLLAARPYVRGLPCT
jgi:long-subunit acyl-CoA synthetase (AMP-forming)